MDESHHRGCNYVRVSTIPRQLGRSKKYAHVPNFISTRAVCAYLLYAVRCVCGYQTGQNVNVTILVRLRPRQQFNSSTLSANNTLVGRITSPAVSVSGGKVRDRRSTVRPNDRRTARSHNVALALTGTHTQH